MCFKPVIFHSISEFEKLKVQNRPFISWYCLQKQKFEKSKPSSRLYTKECQPGSYIYTVHHLLDHSEAKAWEKSEPRPLWNVISVWTFNDLHEFLTQKVRLKVNLVKYFYIIIYCMKQSKCMKFIHMARNQFSKNGMIFTVLLDNRWYSLTIKSNLKMTFFSFG